MKGGDPYLVGRMLPPHVLYLQPLLVNAILMLIPKQVKIGAHVFGISHMGGMPVDDNFGKVRFESLEIFIRNDVPQTQQEETLIHETYHIIRKLAGLEIKDDEHEEQHVQAVAHLLYLFLKENKFLK